MFKFINKIKNKEYSKEKGFSLLELSVAVGVAAIVGTAGIVATTGFIGSAETKKDNYVANAERAIAEAESSSLALGETGSTGGTNSSEEEGAGSEAQEEETPAAPNVPTTVLASDITSTGATLTWGEPETGEVGEYIVTLNGDVQGTEPIPNNVFSYEFTSLTVNTYYEAKVFAKSPAGTLSEAAEEKFYTAFRPMVATGGDKVYDIVQDGTVYRVHEFTTVGTDSFEVESVGESGEVEYLVVAGGGGSEVNANTSFGYRPAPGGGAGAGGYRSSVVGENTGGGLPAEDAISLSSGSFSVTVGSGGDVAEKGEDSSFGDIVSEGGAQGGNNSSFNGGSGSGSGHSGSGGGLGTPGQGFNGGNDTYASPNYPAGGGGGAGGVGGDGACGGCAAGNGGPGVTSNITGTPVTRGGGGGGGTWSNNARGSGGAGGGGAALADGAPNTGGGAGAGGRSGGSGIVIVRYPIQFTSVQ